MSAPKLNPSGGSPEANAGFAFQVNLAGIIELLSQHLYSGPQVYLRELLQNATDAVQARRQLEPGHEGEIVVELVQPREGPATLIFEDDGIGLTEEEVHRFLSTIGLSSKSGDLARSRGDFIGQFGIGLLSGFMVTDEIVMITRSMRPGHPAIEWRGTGDGRYSLKRLEDASVRAGTKVFLRARADAGRYFEASFVQQHLRQYGALLPGRIGLMMGDRRVEINADCAAWKRTLVHGPTWRLNCLDYGEATFDQRFLDCLPLSVPEIGLEGLAYILPASPHLSSRRADRVYVKGMLVSDQVDGLLPEWAFFARCVFNATGLNPGASRESLQDDDRLQVARAGLERDLRNYLLGLAQRDHERLREIVRIHFRAIKLLAAEDDEFYRLFIDWLPFETSLGEQTLKSVRAAGGPVLYAATIDTFRQMAQVAAAQGLCVVNAGYVCDVELLEKLPELDSTVSVRRLEPGDLLDDLEDLGLAETEAFRESLDVIESVLGRFHCDLEVKRFQPADLPALYTVDSSGGFARDTRRARELANDLWAGVLEGLGSPEANGGGGSARSRLCLNGRNGVVAKLLAMRQPEVLRRAVELLYVQSLLQGHYPLDRRERQILGEGLTGLIDLALSNSAQP